MKDLKEEEMEFNFDNDRPIYIQLVNYLKLYIISGKIQLGEKLPSVRELASLAKVNPNTIQKALIELENDKLIYTERTNGKYVTKDRELIENNKQSLAQKTTSKYIEDMINIGILKEDIINYIKKEKK